jgi:LysM repeat protein
MGDVTLTRIGIAVRAARISAGVLLCLPCAGFAGPERDPAASAPLSRVLEQPSAVVSFHRVQPGETLWRIARNHALDLRELARANGIGDASMIASGQLIALPGSAGGAAQPRREDVSDWLERAESALAAARFDEAEALVRGTRELLWAYASPAQRVRLETIGATVELAFGRREGAILCLSRALAVDPSFELDEGVHPRKLEAVLERARARQARGMALPAVSAPAAPSKAAPAGTDAPPALDPLPAS